MDAFDIAKPSELKALLARHGFSFKKQLGQNFLIDRHVLDAIMDAAELTDEVGVFEVGPGAGVVTRLAAERAKTVVAVEKDESLRVVLEDALTGLSNTEVVFADVLKLDLSEIWPKYEGCKWVSAIANLPYYVTTPILFHLFDAGVPLKNVIVMVQREVADRLMAKPGGKDYGALTVAVQYRAEVSKVVSAGPGSFLPPPNVESTVVRMRMRTEPVIQVADEALFFRVVRSAFATRRKTLQNALSAQMGIPKAVCQEIFESCGIDGMRRGETLSIEEFGVLANAFSKRS